MIEHKFKIGDVVKLVFEINMMDDNHFEIYELKKTFNYVNVGNQKLLSSFDIEYKIRNLKNGCVLTVFDGDIELYIIYRRKKLIDLL